MAPVAAVVWVRSLAMELLYALGAANKKVIERSYVRLCAVLCDFFFPFLESILECHILEAIAFYNSLLLHIFN